MNGRTNGHPNDQPLVVRLQGTMSTEGREILAQSNLNITPAETLKEAGELAVAAVKGA